MNEVARTGTATNRMVPVAPCMHNLGGDVSLIVPAGGCVPRMGACWHRSPYTGAWLRSSESENRYRYRVLQQAAI